MSTSTAKEAATGWTIILFFFGVGLVLRLMDTGGNVPASVGGALALLITAGVAFAVANSISKKLRKRALQRVGLAVSFMGPWTLLATAAGASWITKGAAASLGTFLFVGIVLAEMYRGRRTALERAIQADPDIARWNMARSKRQQTLGSDTL